MDNRTTQSSLIDNSAIPASHEHDEFEISTTKSIHEHRPKTLKNDHTFAVFDDTGDIIAAPDSSEGMYFGDTRHLSHYYMSINGGIRPILLSSTLRDDNSVLTCDLTNPDMVQDGSVDVSHNDLIHIRRTKFLYDNCLHECITITNYDTNPWNLTLDLRFSNDFADIFEVRGSIRPQRGTILPPEVGHDHVTLRYSGLDGKDRATKLCFDPPPERLTENWASFRFSLGPHESRTAIIEISCGRADCSEPIRRRYVRAYRHARSALRQHFSRSTDITSSNEIFNDSISRSVSDTYMLLTQTEFGSYPYAGIPWYSTIFGRDGIITALETLWFDPEIARGVLCYLAAHQATDFDADTDAEPGKILHELRDGEMANLREVPFGHYYGSIDSTPLFVMLAGAYLQRTDDTETIERLWPNIVAALNWIDQYGDRDRDGYVEYGRYTDAGLINQGWKDSHDSIFHADGSLAVGPIALAEVQAYVFGAWQAAATMLERQGDETQAASYHARADLLRERFDADFFDEDLETFVLALDGEKKPCRVRSSNAGQVLFTGLARPDRAVHVVRALMNSASFSGWGIRTITAQEARYNPMSYHNGSIWPHDNALIAAGFARYGFRQETARIFEGLFAASTYVDLRRLPELFCGFARRSANGPTFYPVSCIPQAWSAASMIFLLQSCLGLSLDAANKQIQIEHPTLPQFLDELDLGGLHIGSEWINLRFHRSQSKVLVEVPERYGNLRILTCI